MLSTQDSCISWWTRSHSLINRVICCCVNLPWCWLFRTPSIRQHWLLSKFSVSWVNGAYEALVISGSSVCVNVRWSPGKCTFNKSIGYVVVKWSVTVMVLGQCIPLGCRIGYLVSMPSCYLVWRLLLRLIADLNITFNKRGETEFCKIV